MRNMNFSNINKPRSPETLSPDLSRMLILKLGRRVNGWSLLLISSETDNTRRLPIIK
ncbi:hypothetical protein LEMLEM_LOCUS10195, partial [Lemmus lemmus]